VGVLGVACDDSGPPGNSLAPPTPRVAPLLERAVSALGGREVLAGVQTLETRSELQEKGRALSVRVRAILPNHYRHDISMGDALLSHGTDGKTAWAMLDGVQVPLEASEEQRLREQMALTRISLLVSLTDTAVAQVRELSPSDGCEWLEVELPAEDLGPYRLGFDAKTHLMTRANWEAKLPGQIRKSTISLEFSDHRPTGGLMVPFQASFGIGDAREAQDRTREVVVNGPLDAAVFAAPPVASEAPIVTHEVSEVPEVVLDPLTKDAALGEGAVEAWVEEQRWTRNGPTWQEWQNERVLAVGIPIMAPKPGPTTQTRDSVPHYRVSGRRKVLSTVVPNAKRADLDSAEARLREHARANNWNIAERVRHVAWNETITQVQILILER
jgi:hypothetical protein